MSTVDMQITPRKPWRLGRKQLAVNGLVFFGSIAATPILLDLTPLAGKLGAAFIFVVIATIANVIDSVIRQGPRMISNAISSSLIYLATASKRCWRNSPKYLYARYAPCSTRCTIY
jgi:Na+/citrate or Na+/malate symporter